MTAILRSTMMPNSLFKLAGGLEKQRDLQEVHHPAHDRGEDGPVLGLHAVDGHLWVSVVKDEQSTPCPEESNKLSAVTWWICKSRLWRLFFSNLFYRFKLVRLMW